MPLITACMYDAIMHYHTCYSYPGNVRELMNLCERLVVMPDTEVIDIQDLPSHIFCSVAEQVQLMEE